MIRDLVNFKDLNRCKILEIAFKIYKFHIINKMLLIKLQKILVTIFKNDKK